ncbi:STAS domain-containing protein [Streptomyces sp. NBC_01497]|uniref:STAS domain-containing protein n=1 Tax=Streptomyces sp. NBC_01497 TaxID=2903885 RepID=UPI002E30450D|nr:STAS domain-containing protein [Streptomyces sp. NBC_01497]
MSITPDKDERPAAVTQVLGEQYAVPGAWVIGVRGDLDLDTLAPLRDALEAAVAEHPVTILDASGITFADSSALNLLLNTAQGTDLRIAAPSASLLRLLRITGADQVLSVRSDVARAADG